MNTQELEKKWLDIGEVVLKNFRSIKIANDCSCDLSIGLNTERQRCLILSMPDIKGIDIKDEIKDHLGIQFFDVSGHLVVKLFHEEFKDLFNDLVISIYNKIKTITDNKVAARELVSSFRTWCEFFNDSRASKLTKEEIQGLFGEMFYLRTLLKTANTNSVNDFLRCWTGPYDKGQDFIFGTKNIEVKTKDASQIDVNISSEFQLQDEPGKDLHLHIISVESYSGQGQNLREMLDDIRVLTNNLQGDLSILFKALRKKTITIDSVSQYDNFKFNPIKETTYDCCLPGFPRLTQTSVSRGIKNIRYSLRLSGLDEYIIQSIEH